MSLWWRAENGSIDHPKLLKLSDAMHRAWYTLMCVASANDGALPPAEDIAVRLRMNKSKVAEWITKLVAAELFDNIDGVFVPHNWVKRQYKSDTSDPTAAERMKRFRKNKKRNSVTDETERNDRNGAVTVIRPEAEAKPEADSEQSRADAGAPIDEDLKKREAGLKTGIFAHFASRGLTVPPNMDRCLLWLTQGYAAGTVLTAIEAVLKRGKPVSTLEYFDGAIRDAHVKAPTPSLQIVSNKVFVVEGSIEWGAQQGHARETTGRGTPVIDEKDSDGRLTGRRGWLFDSLVPPGFDEATGERLPPKNDEAAA